MEVNKTEQELSGDEILLEEPHFDEESTILSARPVVPLEVVEAKSRSLSRILIGAALVVALLVGAFAASFVYRLRTVQPARDVVATEDPPVQSQVVLESGVAALEPPDPEPVVESEAPEEPTVLDKKQREEPAVVKKVAAKSPPSIAREAPPRAPRNVTRSRRDEPIEEELASQRELNQEIRRAERREERRQERREERRARRVEEAKHQGRDSRSTDDLSRIREIFEGRPKP